MKEIRITNNYEMFKKLDGNRAVEESRVNKIKKSIAKVGYITSPILVNENMEIIDGQGRFEALKQLQLPVEYIVQERIGIKECIAMNVYQTNWTILDYIKSYAGRGLQSYVFLLNLLEKYNLKNISIIAVATQSISKFDEKALKNGELVVTPEQYNSALKKLDFFNGIIQGYKDISRIGLVIKGLLFCADIEGVDLKRLKEKIIEVLEFKKVPPIPTIEELMQFLEELYNKNSKKPTVYIYTEYRKQVEQRLARGKIEYQKKHSLHQYVSTIEENDEDNIDFNELYENVDNLM